MELTGVTPDLQSLGSLRVISVFLSTMSPAIRKDFHCPKCGRICFNYYSDIRMIYDGEVGIQEYLRESSQPHDIMCSRCKTIYRVT